MEISDKAISLLSLFSNITKMNAIDVMDDEERTIFFVNRNAVGKAVGKAGKNIQKLKEKIGKAVFIFPEPIEKEQFIRDMYRDIDILDIKHNDKVSLLIVKEEQRKNAIGRGGERIKAAKKVTREKFGTDLKVVAKRIL